MGSGSPYLNNHMEFWIYCIIISILTISHSITFIYWCFIGNAHPMMAKCKNDPKKNNTNSSTQNHLSVPYSHKTSEICLAPAVCHGRFGEWRLGVAMNFGTYRGNSREPWVRLCTSETQGTTTKIKMSPKKGPFQKKCSSSNHWCSRDIMLAFGGVNNESWRCTKHNSRTQQGRVP